MFTNITIDTDGAVLAHNEANELVELTAAEVVALPEGAVPTATLIQAYKIVNSQLAYAKEKAETRSTAKAGQVVLDNGITLRVSEKGAISFYGLGRWPVTLYQEQVEKLFSAETVNETKIFIASNQAKLAKKLPKVTV